MDQKLQITGLDETKVGDRGYLESNTVTNLKTYMRAKGIKLSGKKADLITRILTQNQYLNQYLNL